MEQHECSERSTELEIRFTERLARAPAGAEYWRCLEELADTRRVSRALQREYPRHASVWDESLDRRGFLKFMGASLALAGLSGCLSPAPAPTDEKIVPYVNQPEEIIPGKPLFFATAMPLGGFGRGVLVESHMGRPTKIEGNPLHPASLGATDVFMQASILDLYDPDRSQVLSNAGRISTWNGFFAAINGELETQRVNQGGGSADFDRDRDFADAWLLSSKNCLANFPRLDGINTNPLARDGARDGSRLAFGEVIETHYRFDRAEVILSLDADFLFFGPASLRYARDFTDKRRVHEHAGGDESALRCRKHADGDRLHGGSPFAAETEHDRRMRHRAGARGRGSTCRRGAELFARG